MKNQYFAAEIDGVFLESDGWKGETVFGKPVPGAIDWVRRMLRRGHKICVFTTREEVSLVQTALVNRGFPSLPVFCVKRAEFTVYIDARTPGFSPEMFEPRFDKMWEGFEPWYQKNTKASNPPKIIRKSTKRSRKRGTH